MKKVLYKLPYEIKELKKNKEKLEKYYVMTNADFNFSAGLIKKEELENENFVKIGKHEVAILDSTFNDEYANIKRGAQTITKKDIGPIITKTGMNKNTKVIDAGAGSGALCCFLAGLVKQVHTYDVSETNLEIVKKNIKKLKLENVTAEKKDIYQEQQFNEEYDVFTLDVPEPWRAWKTALKVLKLGGYLVTYSPNIIQVRETIITKPQEFYHEETIELIEREWTITDKISRPKTKDFSHTAFLSFFRKIRTQTPPPEKKSHSS